MQNALVYIVILLQWGSTIRFRAVRLFYIHRCSLSTQLKHAHQKDQIFIQIFQLDQFHFCS